MEQVAELNRRDSADASVSSSLFTTGEDSQGGGGEAMARGLTAMLESVIKDFDSKALDTLNSQDQLCGSLDRLVQELDQLLENASLPFIVQHASRISSVKQRVSSLNLVLKSIQRRIDNIDHMLSANITQGKMFSTHKFFTIENHERKQSRRQHDDQNTQNHSVNLPNFF